MSGFAGMDTRQFERQIERGGVDSLLPPKRWSISLTKDEIWYLREAFEAAFTEPDERNPIELRLSKKLGDLLLKSRR